MPPVDEGLLPLRADERGLPLGVLRHNRERPHRGRGDLDSAVVRGLNACLAILPANPVNFHGAPTPQLSNTRDELFIAQVESACVDLRFQVKEPGLPTEGLERLEDFDPRVFRLLTAESKFFGPLCLGKVLSLQTMAGDLDSSAKARYRPRTWGDSIRGLCFHGADRGSRSEGP